MNIPFRTALSWLLGCEYVRDDELFHEPDFWQHPRTFERLRRGDCQDHALWTWRNGYLESLSDREFGVKAVDERRHTA